MRGLPAPPEPESPGSDGTDVSPAELCEFVAMCQSVLPDSTEDEARRMSFEAAQGAFRLCTWTLVLQHGLQA